MPDDNAQTIAIIPARGGSQRIPRKNSRLLAGKPLIAWTIETALRVPEIDRVIVSTDDDELSEIATRWGVEVQRRPDELAAPQIGLDDVIAYAVDELERSEGCAVARVVTLQPTSPLLTAATVSAAIAKLEQTGGDTVVSVVDARHLGWTVDDTGAMRPDYEARVNSQWLPPSFRETGGVVVCTREILRSGSRFGHQVFTVVVDKRESVDIDDHFDWWLAEKSLERAKVLFHVVGHREVGMGHVYRALTLADRLIDHEVGFVVSDRSGLAREAIERRRYPVEVLAEGAIFEGIVALEPDVVVNDVLDTDAASMDLLRRAGIVTINFEDVGPGAAHASLVINAMYDEVPGAPANVLAGERWVCMRDEFYSVSPAALREQAGHVLLMFGGTDPNDLTRRALAALEDVPGEFRVTVIAGLGYPGIEALRAAAAAHRRDVEIVVDTPVVSSYMAQADLAITSAGRTVFELASLGVPMVAIAQNAREATHRFARTSPGVIYLGQAEDVEQRALVDALGQVVSSRWLRQQMRRALQQADIRGGTDRVLEVLRERIRPAGRGSRS